MFVREQRNTQKRAAFTLVEVLVVVAIIVVLAGVAVPITLNVLSDAKKDIARAQIKTIMQATKAYQTRHGEPPQTVQELLAPSLQGKGSLTQDAIVDPWGRVFQMRATPTDDGEFNVTVWSEGPNPGAANSKIEINSYGAQTPAQ